VYVTTGRVITAWVWRCLLAYVVFYCRAGTTCSSHGSLIDRQLHCSPLTLHWSFWATFKHTCSSTAPSGNLAVSAGCVFGYPLTGSLGGP